jgi:stage II sporulation protein P
LESQGIKVIHDTALHDDPSYTSAYVNSRKSVQDYLKAYPTIRLVLDLHRDAYEDEQGNQVAQTVFSQGARIAPLMFVVGTDYGGNHPNWQENLALALKLQTLIDNTCPGICRNINLRSQKFNQDLSPGTLLVEVGSAGNAHDEAMRAVEILASGITQLAHGSS